jgi:hypothetical protein
LPGLLTPQLFSNCTLPKLEKKKSLTGSEAPLQEIAVTRFQKTVDFSIEVAVVEMAFEHPPLGS